MIDTVRYTERLRLWLVASLLVSLGLGLTAFRAEAQSSETPTVTGLVAQPYSNALEVSWDPPAGPVDQYAVRLSIDGGPAQFGAATASTSVLLGAVPPASDLVVLVRAWYQGQSVPWTRLSVPVPTSLEPHPLIVTGVSGVQADDGLKVSWDAAPGPLDYYGVRVSVDGAPSVFGALATSNTASLDPITQGSEAVVFVRATSGSSIGPWASAQATVPDSPELDLATWADTAPGPNRMPVITIDDAVYPDAAGVQFWLDGSIDERSKARPNGYDATGPRDDSTFHMYPDLTLNEAATIEARWTDLAGATRLSTVVVGGGLPTEPPNLPPNVPPEEVVHGAQLTENNTGLRGAGYVYDAASDAFTHPEYGALTPSGSIESESDGQVIENIDVDGSVIITHDDVTLRNCRVTYDGTLYAIDARRKRTVSGLLIENCEVRHDGSEPHLSQGIYAGGGTIRWVNVAGFQTAIDIGANTRVEYSRVSDPKKIEGTHGTGMNADGGSGIVFYRNSVEGNSSATLALYAREPYHGVTVEENLFDGGTTPSYCLNAGSNKVGEGLNTNIRIIGNLFGRTAYPECGQFGPYFNYDSSRPGTQWCDNKWIDTGAKIGTDVNC